MVEKDGLLTRPPRMLVAELALVLDVPIGDIPYGALRAWLGRYRKANCTRQKKDTGKNQVPAKEKKKKPDWMDFEPTPLIEVPKEEEPLFKHIKYGDTDR